MRVLFSPKVQQKSNILFNYKNEGYYTKPLSNDFVSFKGNIEQHNINVDFDIADFVANSLTNSTAGHRAEYNTPYFNKDVVELLTLGVAKYINDKAKNNKKKAMAIVGGDTRNATRESILFISETLAKQGIDVLYIKEPIPSPLLAMAAKENNIDTSILLTASHNPWKDGGFNLVTSDGAIAPQSVTKQVSDRIIEYAKTRYYVVDKSKKGTITEFNPYQMYKDYLNSRKLIDWDNIRNSNMSIYYDGLNGAGNYVLPKLLEENGIKCNIVSAPKKLGPNPIDENLSELKEYVANDSNTIKAGFSNDGDADRLGVVDENGQYIGSHEIILLIAYHLHHNKNMSGTIMRSQSTSSILDEYARKNGLEVAQTPVGFKFIGADILKRRSENDDILIAGEESGGLTIKGHIPEKDGVLAILLLLDLMAKEGKSLTEILEEQKSQLGKVYNTESINKELLNNVDKDIIINQAEEILNDAVNQNAIKFGGFTIDIDKTQENAELMKKFKSDGDGVKLYFTDGSSVLIRKSGTEPLIRFYIETVGENNIETNEKAEAIKSHLRDIKLM